MQIPTTPHLIGPSRYVCLRPAHSKADLQLICLESTCKQERLCCLRCADEFHSRHELISFAKFQKMMLDLQSNNGNKDKKPIMKGLKEFRDYIINKIEASRSKMLALYAQCQNSVEIYFNKLYKSFTMDPHPTQLRHLYTYLSNQKVDEYFKLVQELKDIRLGSFMDVSILMETAQEIIKGKITKTTTTINDQLTKLKIGIQGSLKLSQSDTPFKKQFSRQKKSSLLQLSDTMRSVERLNGQGGYPICLLASPFDPIHNKVSFIINKQGDPTRKAVWIGVCLHDVVKPLAYQNCAGMGKGTYAIDQASPYYMGGDSQGLLTSWNHHDSQYNQTSQGGGAGSLVGWKLDQGEKITVEVDFINQVLLFIKWNIPEGEQSEEEEQQIYEMPISIDQGPIYAFAGTGNKGDCISIVDQDD